MNVDDLAVEARSGISMALRIYGESRFFSGYGWVLIKWNGTYKGTVGCWWIQFPSSNLADEVLPKFAEARFPF
jgi:hypothetical protein